MICPDKNFPGNFLLIESATTMYSFHYNDMVNSVSLPDGRTQVSMLPGSVGMKIIPHQVKSDIGILADIHTSNPPEVIIEKGQPTLATIADINMLQQTNQPLVASIAGAASQFVLNCDTLGATPSVNNCAHYLSNAFIKAGYTELRRKQSEGGGIFHAWCDTLANPPVKNDNARPIRAMEMHEWFKVKATKSQRTRPNNSGFWAVYQYDSSKYCCGHVLILDSGTNKVYGTGVFWNWVDQYFYQW